MKLLQYSNLWLNSKSVNIKPKTLDIYCYHLNKIILPHLGQIQIKKLTENNLRTFVLTLAKDKRYSTNTILASYKILKACMSDYYKQYNKKPLRFKNITLPTTTEKSIECFLPQEQTLIENSIDITIVPNQIGILLSLYLGLRLGELIALGWQDIDFTKNLIKITKSAYYKNKQLILSSPKTKTSMRTIPIPNFLVALLKSVKKSSKSNFVLSDKNGNGLIPRTYQYEFEVMLKKLNIPHRGFHSLRHTFATRAVECGMDIKSLADILGHSNPTITLKRYTHSMLEYKKQLLNKLSQTYKKSAPK